MRFLATFIQIFVEMFGYWVGILLIYQAATDDLTEAAALLAIPAALVMFLATRIRIKKEEPHE